MTEMPPLREEEFQGIKYLVDDLVPGWIVAHSGIQFGVPTLKGTRFPTSSTWCFDDPSTYGWTTEQAFAARCFEAGVQWQRSRERRKRMSEVVAKLWKELEPPGGQQKGVPAKGKGGPSERTRGQERG